MTGIYLTQNMKIYSVKKLSNNTKFIVLNAINYKYHVQAKPVNVKLKIYG